MAVGASIFEAHLLSRAYYVVHASYFCNGLPWFRMANPRFERATALFIQTGFYDCNWKNPPHHIEKDMRNFWEIKTIARALMHLN